MINELPEEGLTGQNPRIVRRRLWSAGRVTVRPVRTYRTLTAPQVAVADQGLDVARREPGVQVLGGVGAVAGAQERRRHSASHSDSVRVASRTGSLRLTRSRAAAALAFASVWVRP
jgi:hypothetical protein